MLYLLVPWTATNLVDFFFVRRGHYAIADLFTPDGIYGAWGWRGLIAYGVGFAAEIPFMVLPGIAGFNYTGPVAKHISGVDIAWIVGLVVSGDVVLAALALARPARRGGGDRGVGRGARRRPRRDVWLWTTPRGSASARGCATRARPAACRSATSRRAAA